MHDVILSFGFGIVTAAVVALAGVGVTLQYGVTNYLNFAYGSYMALGAYVTWTLNVDLHINFWVAVAIAAICIGMFATVVNVAVLRPFARRKQPAVYMLIVTLGIWLILSNVIPLIWGSETVSYVVGGSAPLNIGPFLFSAQQLLIVVVAVALLAGLHVLLRRTKLGKAMRAASDDSTLAQVTGIDLARIEHITWFITGCLISIGGSALALTLSSFQPTFGDDFLFVVFAAVIVGGIGHPYGTLIGALIVGITTEVSAVVVSSAYKTDIAFILLVAMLFIRPQGLIPAPGRH